MAKFYIFRHGETFATKSNSNYGFTVFSAPILEEGKPVIIKMAKFLKKIPSDFNASSPLKRCRQTAEIVTEVTGKEFVFDKRLTEFFFETHWGFERRVKSFLDQIEKASYQNMMICTHGAVLMMLKRLLLKTEKKKLNFFDYPKPGVLWIVENGKLEEINFN